MANLDITTATQAQKAGILSALQAPQVFAQSGVPRIILPAGTFNASGLLTLGTALNYTPSGNVWTYLFAGNGLSAGLYQATFSDTTHCQLVGSPATTSGAYAGGTGPATMLSIAIPGGTLGPNGSLRVDAMYDADVAGSSRTAQIKFGTASLVTNSFGGAWTQLGLRHFGEVANRGALNVNASQVWISYGGVAANTVYYTIDTSVDQNVTILITNPAAVNYTILSGYKVTTQYGA